MPIDLSQLDDEFRADLDEVFEKCKGLGVVMRPYCGTREPAEQARLWRQSRSRERIETQIAELQQLGAPYLAEVIESVGPQSGRHVTNAIPGLSWHQWGEAIDCFWLVDRDAEWSTTKKATLTDGRLMNGYRLYAEVAGEIGLTAGGLWRRLKDWPHLQKHSGSVKSVHPTMREIDREMKARWGPI